MCGGTVRRRRAIWLWRGLSPRVRGNLCTTDHDMKPAGSIPACAGEPSPIRIRGPHGKVYPRVCGGTLYICPQCGGKKGLSPRVRGNPLFHHPQGRTGRSIPACAGEPRRPRRSLRRRGVYPRVCGGTDQACKDVARLCGLSPRVRGNHHGAPGLVVQAGSIPACAGEPGRTSVQSPAWWVYPRVCGGTAPSPMPPTPRRGLSPRVRGNRGQGR